MATGTPSSGRLRFDNFEIDLRSGEVWKHGRRVRLQDQPFQLLRVLIERRGEVVARDELKQILWPGDTFVDFDDGLNTAVKKIRDVLGDSSERPRYIETIPRRGYRFIHSVELSLSGRDTKHLANSGQVTAHASPEVGASPRVFRRVGSVAVGVLVLVFALIGADVGGRRLRVHGNSPAPQIRSLAVLPLKNLSGDATQEYLADGMTEALIGRLAGIRDLRVISRTSTMQFKNTQLSVPEISKTLHVDAVVEGSVIRDGSRIRVHAQLIRASTDEHFWSETYDRELRDVLALQSDVAQSIARKVEVTVSGQEHSKLVAASHVSPEVYESYLRGQFAKKYNRAEIEQSIAYFEDAIAKDATFAPAYVGLANAYNSLSTVFVGGRPKEIRPKVIAAARKALELDPELADAHVLLGTTLQKQWQWEQAEREYRRALEISPNNASAHIGLASWLLCQGRIEEALAWSLRARELDPLGDSGVTIGWIQFQARHYNEAIRELRSVLAVHPDDAIALWDLGFALIGKGQYDEAIPVLQKTVNLTDRSPGSLELLATAYGYAGRRVEALRLLDEMKKRQKTVYVPAGAFINPYFGLHDYDRVFAGFEQAYQEQSNILQFLKVHPFFDPVRSDPRFVDLLHRVGLDQAR